MELLMIYIVGLQTKTSVSASSVGLQQAACATA